MTEKEAYLQEWIEELSTPKEELGGSAVCPYASTSKTSIVETPIDDIVPESGYDVIIFIVEDFWKPHQLLRWVEHYNRKYTYYKFYDDSCLSETFINGIRTNNQKFNLVLCQSKRKLNAMRKKLAETDYYSYWSKEYLEEVLGEDIKIVEKTEKEDISG